MVHLHFVNSNISNNFQNENVKEYFFAFSLKSFDNFLIWQKYVHYLNPNQTVIFLLSIDRDPKSWADSAHDFCKLINLELLIVESSNFG